MKIEGQSIQDVWAPTLTFLKVIEAESILSYGKTSPGLFDFWLQRKNNQSHMMFYQAVKVKFTCHFDFEHYPFDSHECHLDFGLLQNTFNESIIMECIKILGKDSKARFLKGRVKIPNQHLPYKFSIWAKESFPWYNYDYFSPFSGIIILAQRDALGTLIFEFYLPTGVFAVLALISFLINPDVVGTFLYLQFSKKIQFS